MTADFLVEDHGSVVLVEPVSVAASRLLAACIAVEGWQWLGARFAVEPRMLDGLLALIDDHGCSWSFCA